MPNQLNLSNILPSPLYPHLIEGELSIRLDLLLGWKSMGSLIIVYFKDAIIHQSQTINEPFNPVSLLLFKWEIDIFFQPKGLPLVKGIISFEIVGNTFFSQTPIVLRTIFLPGDLNHLPPILIPTLMVECDEFFQAVESGHF